MIMINKSSLLKQAPSEFYRYDYILFLCVKLRQ